MFKLLWKTLLVFAICLSARGADEPSTDFMDFFFRSAEASGDGLALMPAHGLVELNGDMESAKPAHAIEQPIKLLPGNSLRLVDKHVSVVFRALPWKQLSPMRTDFLEARGVKGPAAYWVYHVHRPPTRPAEYGRFTLVPCRPENVPEDLKPCFHDNYLLISDERILQSLHNAMDKALDEKQEETLVAMLERLDGESEVRFINGAGPIGRDGLQLEVLDRLSSLTGDLCIKTEQAASHPVWTKWLAVQPTDFDSILGMLNSEQPAVRYCALLKARNNPDFVAMLIKQGKEMLNNPITKKLIDTMTSDPYVPLKQGEFIEPIALKASGIVFKLGFRFKLYDDGYIERGFIYLARVYAAMDNDTRHEVIESMRTFGENSKERKILQGLQKGVFFSGFPIPEDVAPTIKLFGQFLGVKKDEP